MVVSVQHTKTYTYYLRPTLTPYTYTLRPALTPYTLHMHPASCTLHSAPCT